MVDRVRQHKKKTLVWLVFVLVPSLFCNMATEGKQLHFDLEREREILLLLRQARAKGVGIFRRGHPALDEVDPGVGDRSP